MPAESAKRLVAQMKGEIMILVLETADVFRATVGALRSFDKTGSVSFHILSVLENRCLHLFKRMP
jgi:hypothetical protein